MLRGLVRTVQFLAVYQRWVARTSQTRPGGSFASGGGSTHISRNTSLHLMCHFHVNETQLQRSIVSRYSFGHGFRNQKLELLQEVEWMRRSSRSPSSVLLRFFTSFTTNPFVSFICVDSPRLDHSVRTTLSNWDTTVHLHREVSS